MRIFNLSAYAAAIALLAFGPRAALAIDGTLIPISPAVTTGDVDGFTLTPDGQTIVFVGTLDNGQGEEAYAIPATGGTAIQLSNSPGDVDDPPVADNDFAYYLDDQGNGNSNNIWHKRPLDGSGTPLAITPDDSEAQGALINGGSTFIYLDDGSPDVVSSVPTDGSATRTILTLPNSNDIDQAQWDVTSDGATLIYGFINGLSQPSEFASVLTDGSSASPTPILPVGLPSGDQIIDMELSSDDSTIFFTAGPAEATSSLYSMPAAGGAVTEIVSLTGGLDDIDKLTVSPDGSKIAFVGDVGGHALLFVANADGSMLTNLTPDHLLLPDTHDVAGGFGDVHWSPDSKNLYFISDQITNGTGEIFVVAGTPVPEPAALALVGLALGVLPARRRS